EAPKPMASLLNRDGLYYATFSDSNRKPRQRRHSLKTRSKRTAERLLARLDDAYREGAWDPWTQAPDDFLNADRIEDPKRASEAVALYVVDMEAAYTATTRRTRKAMMHRFVAHVGGSIYLERLTPQHVETFVQAGNVARSTQNERLIGLKAFCT